MLNTLDLDNHEVVYDQVEPITTIQFDALVLDRQWNLSFKVDASEVELMTKTLLVSRFQEPGTERSVHLNGSTNDTLG